MNNKKSFFLFLILFSSFLFCDWKKDIRKYFGSIPNYENAADYLSKFYPSASANDQPQLSLILGYIYRNLNDKTNENYYITEHFEKFFIYRPAPAIDFLSDARAVEINDYYLEWQSVYPLVQDFSLVQDQFPFDAAPNKIAIQFKSISGAGYRVYLDKKIIQEGTLKKGLNQLIVDISPILELEIVSNKITLKKILHIVSDIKKPESVDIVDGKITLKGESIKQETTQKVTTTSTRYFDKEFFRKYALPNMAIGVVGLGANLLFVNKPEDPFLSSFHKTANIAFIGVSLKGIYDFIKCFKSKGDQVVSIEKDQAAIEYNQKLRDKLRDLAQQVRIYYQLNVELVSGGKS